jgi:hypothetical protein
MTILSVRGGTNSVSSPVEKSIGTYELHALCSSGPKTVSTLTDVAIGLAGCGGFVLLMGFTAFNPIALAVGAVMLFAAGVIGVCAWGMNRICTPTQANIQTLCDRCRGRHPEEFAEFMRNLKIMNVPANRNERDSAVLLAIVKFIGTNDIFTPRERMDILSAIRLLPSAGPLSASSSETLRLLAKAGVTRPFVDCFARINNYHNKGAIFSQFLPAIAQMPEDAQTTLLTHERGYLGPLILEILTNCNNPEDIELLLTMVDKLPQAQRDELLKNEAGKGCVMAHRFAYHKCGTPALLRQFLDLYPSDAARLAMLKCPNEYGFTFALFLCSSPPDVMKSFFSILKDFSKEDRLKILSQLSERHENVYTMLTNRGRDAVLESPEFQACLADMGDDQRKLCTYIAPPPQAKPARLGDGSDQEDDESEELGDESERPDDDL